MDTGAIQGIHSKKHGSKKPASANTLTKDILAYLKENGFEVWRNNTMGVFDTKQAIKKLIACMRTVLSGKAKLEAKAIGKILNSSYRKHHGRKGIPDVIGYRKSDGNLSGWK